MRRAAEERTLAERRYRFAAALSEAFKGYPDGSRYRKIGFYRKRKYVETHSSSKGCRLCACERCWQALEKKRARLAGRLVARKALLEVAP